MSTLAVAMAVGVDLAFRLLIGACFWSLAPTAGAVEEAAAFGLAAKTNVVANVVARSNTRADLVDILKGFMIV